MRSDLVDWVEFVDAADSDAPKPFQPLIDLGEDGDNQEVGPEETDGSVVGKDGDVGGLEFVRLKPLQLCIVKIQNLLKVILALSRVDRFFSKHLMVEVAYNEAISNVNITLDGVTFP